MNDVISTTIIFLLDMNDTSVIHLPSDITTWEAAIEYISGTYSNCGDMDIYYIEINISDDDDSPRYHIETKRINTDSYNTPGVLVRIDMFYDGDLLNGEKPLLLYFKEGNGKCRQRISHNLKDVDDVFEDECFLRRCLKIWYKHKDDMNKKEQLHMKHIPSPLSMWAKQVIIRDRNDGIDSLHNGEI